MFAVRYGTLANFPLRSLLPDAPAGEAIDVALMFWAIRSEDRVVLFDTGFFRDSWFDRFDIRDFVRPDLALERIRVDPEDVTDIVVSHAHWDHMGGLELFPEATIWIQEAEYEYYTGAAWQPGGRTGGIDPADVQHLVARNTRGAVRFIPGDSVEILPGFTVYTGARHTYASQYLLVDGPTPFVLASDNAYLYRNFAEGRASATFSPADREGNLAEMERMILLAGDTARVVPGHDPEVFHRYPAVAEGVVRIRP